MAGYRSRSWLRRGRRRGAEARRGGPGGEDAPAWSGWAISWVVSLTSGRQRLQHHITFLGDDGEVGAGRCVGLSASLLPFL